VNRSGSTFRAYLELSRISNLPTVWTNVLVGWAIAHIAYVISDIEPVINRYPFSPMDSYMRWFFTAIAVSLLYVCGMALNDIADLRIDRKERPDRPLPSGRATLKGASRFVLICALLGLGVLAALHWIALLLGIALVFGIFVYDYTHKQFPQAVVVMGICRFLVYFIAMTAAAPHKFASFDPILTAKFAAILGLYTVAITIVARSEASGRLDTRKWLAVLMPIGVLVGGWFCRPLWEGQHWQGQTWHILVAGGALALWLALPVAFVFRRPPRTIHAVLCWLSGMCLVDAYFLTLLAHPTAALIAGGCFILTAFGHRHIMGT